MRNYEVQPRFDKDVAYKIFTNDKKKHVSHAIKRKIARIYPQLEEYINPHLVYRTEKIKKKNKASIVLEGGIQFKSLKLAKALRYADRAVLFLGTIGGVVDERIDSLMEQNSLSEAYMLDAMASHAVEDMVNRFQNRMERKNIKRDLSVTLRFSPGYCDWPVTEQQKLFTFFEGSDVNVNLTETSLMQPRKSISGIFGLAPLDSPRYNPCRECGREDCEARRCPSELDR